MGRRLKVLTVGCKANFADSATVAAEAVSAGFTVVGEGDPADVVVVNGCTVTHRADRDSRSLARRARRENPRAEVVMAGCYGELSGEGAARLPEADHWVGTSRPGALARLLRQLAGPAARAASAPSGYAAGLLLGRRRMFLKIQDGCDARCAYCVVPLARGPSRSAATAEVVETARQAEREGAREIVLTGIHAGLYGRERGETFGLAGLLRALLEATAACRLRLGSIEPLEIGPALLEIMAREGRVCPHLHVPLQSGSDRVLQRMRRPYTAARYLEAVGEAAARVPSIRIGADVIAGFPGETEDDFAETLALLGRAPVHYLHAFPYSARRGTESASWPDDVSAGRKKERIGRLRALDRRMRGEFLGRQVGEVLEVLAERVRGEGRLAGYSGNYATVSFPGDAGGVGSLHRVRIVGTAGDGLAGVPAGSPAGAGRPRRG